MKKYRTEQKSNIANGVVENYGTLWQNAHTLLVIKPQMDILSKRRY